MFSFLKRLFGRTEPRQAQQPESAFMVEVDDEIVRCVRPNGDVEQVAWRDLRAVILETNDSGPYGPDVIWILVGSDSGCVIPMGASGEAELLDALQRLPEFDNEAMAGAMSSVENERFLCWERT